MGMLCLTISIIQLAGRQQFITNPALTFTQAWAMLDVSQTDEPVHENLPLGPGDCRAVLVDVNESHVDAKEYRQASNIVGVCRRHVG